MKNKITDKKHFKSSVKCAENGVTFKNVKHMMAVIYGEQFKDYASVYNMVLNNKPIKGNHYYFVEGK